MLDRIEAKDNGSEFDVSVCGNWAGNRSSVFGNVHFESVRIPQRVKVRFATVQKTAEDFRTTAARCDVKDWYVYSG